MFNLRKQVEVKDIKSEWKIDFLLFMNHLVKYSENTLLLKAPKTADTTDHYELPSQLWQKETRQIPQKKILQGPSWNIFVLLKVFQSLFSNLQKLFRVLNLCTCIQEVFTLLIILDSNILVHIPWTHGAYCNRTFQKFFSYISTAESQINN